MTERMSVENPQELRHEIIRTVLDYLQVGISIDIERRLETLVDSGLPNCKESIILRGAYDLVGAGFVIRQQRRIRAVVVEDYDIVVTSRFKGCNEPLQVGDAVVVVDDDRDSLRIIDFLPGNGIAQPGECQDTIVVNPAAERPETFRKHFSQKCFDICHHKFFQYALRPWLDTLFSSGGNCM